EAVAHVEVGSPPFACQVIAVCRECRDAAGVIPGASIRILNHPVEVSCNGASQSDLQRMTRQSPGGFDLPLLGEVKVGPPGEERRQRRVYVWRGEEIETASADVADRQRQAFQQLPFNASAELRRVRDDDSGREPHNARGLGCERLTTT